MHAEKESQKLCNITYICLIIFSPFHMYFSSEVQLQTLKSKVCNGFAGTWTGTWTEMLTRKRTGHRQGLEQGHEKGQEHINGQEHRNGHEY
jgi:hypothetical protein